ncbi:hypothetical protein GGX14DRAFT_584580 [Mycena pura]|uniref:Uncharacterized protein n=1 Tax=Mycena pura TaxID=153505 RepID=A0AAD6YVU7_9AGAR|nr:hypothetical protein GGX14DRAFT_584580 [Mycena pura]
MPHAHALRDNWCPQTAKRDPAFCAPAPADRRPPRRPPPAARYPPLPPASRVFTPPLPVTHFPHVFCQSRHPPLIWSTQPGMSTGGVDDAVTAISVVVYTIHAPPPGHNISFFIAQQRLAPLPIYTKPVPNDILPLYMFVPPDLHKSTGRTIGYACFILDTLDDLPDPDLILKDHDYCVVLWNDDRNKHSYEEIAKLLADLTRDDTAELTPAARDGPHVDTSGLGVTMRRAHDTFEFRKQVLSVITKREVLAKKKFEAAADPEGDDSFARAHKLAVVGHLANVYHRVVDDYLFVDRREAKTSIGYFALQLLTVPSASVHPVRNHKLVSRILAIISAFFLNQI